MNNLYCIIMRVDLYVESMIPSAGGMVVSTILGTVWYKNILVPVTYFLLLLVRQIFSTLTTAYYDSLPPPRRRRKKKWP